MFLQRPTLTAKSMSVGFASTHSATRAAVPIERDQLPPNDRKMIREERHESREGVADCSDAGTWER